MKKKLLLTLSMVFGSHISAIATEFTPVQLHATIGIITNFILDDGIVHNGTKYKTVTSPYTGKVWLDRNLGASKVCAALDDTACYGDYYQWGRAHDGHESSSSNSTVDGALALDINDVTHGDFIVNTSSPYDWSAATVDDNASLRAENWSKTDGSSVCPVGFRVPTINELKLETVNNTKGDVFASITDGYNNFLKLPSAGFRANYDGLLYSQASNGLVWSSSVTGSYLYFNTSNAGTKNGSHAFGFSVRCLRD